jgi:hypothetical protein
MAAKLIPIAKPPKESPELNAWRSTVVRAVKAYAKCANAQGTAKKPPTVEQVCEALKAIRVLNHFFQGDERCDMPASLFLIKPKPAERGPEQAG